MVRLIIAGNTMTKPDASETLSALGHLARWEQQEAKAKFSELIRRARGEGPQLVTTRGGKPVIVIAADDYVALTENRPTSFRDLLVPGDDFEPVRAGAPARHRPVSL
jgi:prevent-host-death family protein